ncbi:MAG TPA: hypothetical protein VGJ22_10830 [Anaerolineales bacterium]|jgi:hypothetical protein
MRFPVVAVLPIGLLMLASAPLPAQDIEPMRSGFDHQLRRAIVATGNPSSASRSWSEWLVTTCPA